MLGIETLSLTPKSFNYWTSKYRNLINYQLSPVTYYLKRNHLTLIRHTLGDMIQILYAFFCQHSFIHSLITNHNSPIHQTILTFSQKYHVTPFRRNLSKNTLLARVGKVTFPYFFFQKKGSVQSLEQYQYYFSLVC